MRCKLLFATVVLVLACSCARADVGIVLNESLDTSVARITGSGHSAVYFSRICPESPVKLRLCRPDESGSVMSNYTTLGEDQPFEWNIAPLNVYLYGVEDTRDRPLFATEKIKEALEERYLEEYLPGLCSGACATSKKAEWHEMVAATAERSIYIFVVKTTPEQDRRIVEEFNALPNQNHFNAFTRNCANFTRKVIDTYFPHAVHPDYINDFGMTSPKAIARSFALYAHKHPNADYRVLHFAQMPGTLKRSTVARDGTEQLFRSKKLLVPMLFVASHELPVIAASYLITGRFDPEREFEDHPSTLASEVAYEIKLARQENDKLLIDSLRESQLQEKDAAVGSQREWKRYREEYDSLVDEALRLEIIGARGEIGHAFREISERGTPFIDANNSLWLEFEDGGRTTKVGLSPSSITSSASDPQLSYEILLAHADRVFNSPAHSREAMPQFKQDWELLQTARSRVAPLLALR